MLLNLCEKLSIYYSVLNRNFVINRSPFPYKVFHCPTCWNFKQNLSIDHMLFFMQHSTYAFSFVYSSHTLWRINIVKKSYAVFTLPTQCTLSFMHIHDTVCGTSALSTASDEQVLRILQQKKLLQILGYTHFNNGRLSSPGACLHRLPV